MILNLGSLAFNANIETGGGTPAWGTEMGQGDGYKFAFEDMSDFFTGLVYCSISDMENVTCPLGKGGNQQSDYDFVIASLFHKIFVNGIHVNDAQFLLLVVKKHNGEYHVGRRTLKYNPRMTYKDIPINEECYQKIALALGLSNDAAWFIHEINICNQDELHFTAYVLAEHIANYSSNEERRNAFLSKLPKGDKLLLKSGFDSKSCGIQQIFYGAPGTGKSKTIKDKTEKAEKDGRVFRTTFHPDSDYSTFVGCYKPKMKLSTITKDGVTTTEEKIVYKFEPQVFTNAYVNAWNTEEDVYLIIEEINRGNCAQIFGDLFQLLDRHNGISEYPVDADSSLADYLLTALADSKRDNFPTGVKEGKKLVLPSNLYIWATMNTSDQSLFPIDSAFKRRWDWKYIPIKEHPEKSYKIEIGEKTYDWWGFLERINKVIGETTSSEDKKLGYFFVKTETAKVSNEQFVGKVLFYIWNDVFKNYGFDHTIFSKGEKDKFVFSDFFNADGTPNKDNVQLFLKRLEDTVKIERPLDITPKEETTTASEDATVPESEA